MLYNRQRLPLVDIKKVKVFNKESYSFEIEYCLKEIITKSLSDYRTELKERKNINIVFIIMTSEMEVHLPGLQNSSLRPAALTQIKRDYPQYVRERRMSELSTESQITKIDPLRQSIEKIATTTSKELVTLPQLSQKSIEDITNIHLISFLQFADSSSTITKYHITRDSDINYELVMSRATSGMLEASSKRSVFYANSIADPSVMIPYNGSAHYHSKDNPGPGGYVGWMAGHSKGKMGPKLEVREVDNYKIILEDSLEIDKKQKKHAEIPNSFPINSKGDSVLKASRTMVNPGIASVAPMSPHSILEASRSAEEKEKKTFFFGLGNQSSHITTATSSIKSSDYAVNKYGNYYGSVFGIDFLSMLRYRSRHGTLIDFHFNRGEMSVVTEALSRSVVSRIEVQRKRISNKPNIKNQKGTFEHTEYSRDQKEKRIVLSSDTENNGVFKGKLRRFRSLDGEIQEISLAALTQSGQVFEHPECKYMRQFLFKDFDLFHNNTEGTYTYSVYVEISDGMESLLKDRQKKLQQAIVKFEKYSQYLRITKEAKNYQNKQSSNKMNYENNKVNKKNKSFVNSVANLYFEVLNLLEGKVISENNRNSIINAISSTNLDLSSVDKFLSSLKRANGLFKGRVKQENNNYKGKVSSSNLTGVIPGNISETFKTNMTVRAFNESKVIANYIPDLGISPVIQVSNLTSKLALLGSKSYSGSYSPTSLLAIKGQQYKSEDSFSLRARKEKKISQLEISTIAKSSDNLTPTDMTNLKFKMAVLEQEGAERESLLDKGDLFYSRKVQLLGSGLKFKINGRDIASIDDSEIENSDKTSLSEPDISSSVQKSLLESNRDIEEKDKIIKDLEKEYRNIVNIKDKLGPIYDGMSSYVKSTGKIVSSTGSDKIYQNKYRGRISQQSQRESISALDEYACKLKVILPGIYEQEIGLEGLTLDRAPGDSQTPRLIMMKLETIFPRNILQANNIFFVEV